MIIAKTYLETLETLIDYRIDDVYDEISDIKFELSITPLISSNHRVLKARLEGFEYCNEVLNMIQGTIKDMKKRLDKD